jgi:hypothetical protein
MAQTTVNIVWALFMCVTAHPWFSGGKRLNLIFKNALVERKRKERKKNVPEARDETRLEPLLLLLLLLLLQLLLLLPLVLQQTSTHYRHT